MFSFIKKHPFAVETHFDNSTVLTFAVKKDHLERFIPACLQLDTFKNEWAFIAVAMVQTKNLRPKGFPSFLGNNFFLIGYRIFVRYTANNGKKLRGLFILKSETNKKKMELFGNIFTQYKYCTTDISSSREGPIKVIESLKSDFYLKMDFSDNEISLPEFSPFENWKEARRFAGPLPFTFTYNEKSKEVLIIEGVRKNWNPKPVDVLEYKFSFLEFLQIDHPILANAFEINNVPYYWKKAKKEIWKP